MFKSRFFYFGLLPALLFQMIGAALYYLWDSNFSQWIYTGTKLLLVVWPLLWLPFMKKLQAPRTVPVFSGTASGLMSGIFFASLLLLLFGLGLSPNLSEVQAKVQQFGLSDPNLYLIFAFFLSLFHSFLEEYYWRWFIFKGLQTKYTWIVAASMSSIAFAGHHFFILSGFFSLGWTLLGGTAVGLAGFFWCFLYKKYQTLLPAYLSHLLVDAMLMGIGYTILF